MFLSLALAIGASGSALIEKDGGREAIQIKVSQLGSPDFRKREEAMKWLLERPHSEAVVRMALPSAGAESGRRLTLVLDDFERRPLKNLDAFIRKGDLGRAMAVISEWPAGKQEAGVWAAAKELAESLRHAIKRRGFGDFAFSYVNASALPIVLCEERVTRLVRDSEKDQFVRAKQVDLSELGQSSPTLIFARDSVRLGDMTLARPAIFAGGSVHIREASRAIIVSGGDVVVEGPIFGCVIIAAGEVTCYRMSECRIVSGKVVHYNRKSATGCIVQDHDPNPLNFLRLTSIPPAGAKQAVGGP